MSAGNAWFTLLGVPRVEFNMPPSVNQKITVAS
jgi:hypothetical protein